MKVTALFLLLLAPAIAQTVDDPDAEGCKDSKLVNRMKACKITECRKAEHDQSNFYVRKDEGTLIDQQVEGEYEQINFVCPANMSPLQITRNIVNAFTTAGYQQVLYDRSSPDNQYLTMRKGSQWVGVEAYMSNEPHYILTTVLEKAVDQQLAATAEAWTAEIENSGRVRVYGINFETGKATITADSENALNELLKMLQEKSDWTLMIEGHTDNVGAKAANLALSRQRADAVAEWLAAKGIDKARLTTAGFGDGRPVADNSTEEGRQQNRRVEIAKL
jgi:OmpA-OmpF porin, OOP family